MNGQRPVVSQQGIGHPDLLQLRLIDPLRLKRKIKTSDDRDKTLNDSYLHPTLARLDMKQGARCEKFHRQPGIGHRLSVLEEQHLIDGHPEPGQGIGEQ